MEQLSDDELDHAAEEDSDKEDQDLDKMFGAWLGELDKLTQSLDDGKPEKVQKAPLRQETNLANFSYRFSMYNINEALNQGDAVDLDALMADLCSIEQELSSISKPHGGAGGSRLGVPGGEAKLRQKPPPGRSGSAKHGAGGSSGGSSSGGSSARASPSSTVRGGSSHARPLASNLSLDDITAQLEQASLSMDEAARQSSSPTSAGPAPSPSLRRLCCRLLVLLLLLHLHLGRHAPPALFLLLILAPPPDGLGRHGQRPRRAVHRKLLPLQH
ncbi:hypothetical protein ANANG_G00055110 [Anguilla anguilla]|uniref:Uncharacterized protein n=1 Tax=Anguilla anguilla TaxID=7936 RepID=A0A9D3MMU8_ANGAN|nr:hypothetical protein ANANG_G00055110 [Anguilla anguilla]